ncbi:MAG: hypothetical protein NTV29_04740 [Planctomycetota bacterium]|nr:hypothetical protein [Planctomycetota bacterium]
MSSNYRPLPLAGIVLQGGIPVGGLAIPADHPDEFIYEFNQKYEAIGLRAKSLSLPSFSSPQTNPSPDNPDS